jgi:hypothetical protein
MTMRPVGRGAAMPQQAAMFGGMSPWQAPLAALFSGLSAAGQPGGWSNFGVGANQGLQNFQQGQVQAQQMDLRQQQIQAQQDEMRAAEEERARVAATRQKIAAILGGQATAGGPTGGSAARGDTGQSAILGDMTPQQSMLFQVQAEADPEAALQMLTERAFATPQQDEWQLKTFKEGGQEITAWVNPRTQERRDVASGPAYAPQQSNGELWEPYTDPKTGMTGQRNTRTHKVDWDPGQTGGIQVDTNGDGTPDITVGGKGMAPPTATAGQANVRGLLVQQGLEDIANVDFDKVSAGKIAAADFANSKGAVGELAGNLLLNDDEKRLLGAQGAIQEAVISAITGAAYSEEQKRNMRAKYVIQPTDSPTRRAEKVKAAAQFLAQLDRNSGNSRIPTDPATPTEDGYTIEELP